MDVRTSIIDLFIQGLSAAGVQAEETVAEVKEFLANGIEIEDSKLMRFIEDCANDNH